MEDLPPPSTQVQGALSETHDDVQATPTTLKGTDGKTRESFQATPVPLKGKEASFEQSVQRSEPKAQPSMPPPPQWGGGDYASPRTPTTPPPSQEASGQLPSRRPINFTHIMEGTLEGGLRTRPLVMIPLTIILIQRL